MHTATYRWRYSTGITRATSAERKHPISHLNKSYFRIKDARARARTEALPLCVQQGEPSRAVKFNTRSKFLNLTHECQKQTHLLNPSLVLNPWSAFVLLQH